jgi:peptidyl-prolyl cis-trans isomerase D
MMRYMRNNAIFVVTVIIFIVAVFIGTIFLVWGRGSMTSSSEKERSVAAWVGTEEVPYADFLRAHDTRLEFYRRFYPNLTADDLEKRFRIRKGALDAVVGRRLLLDEAARLGLKASAEEVRRKIEQNPGFQANGAFDPATYRQALAGARLSVKAFEEDTRTEILVGKVRAIVQETVQVPEAEAFEDFRHEKEKVRLSLLTFPPGAGAAAPPVGADEARRAFDADPEKYTRPERAQFAYVALLAREVPAGTAPTEEELKRYYDEHAQEFQTPKSVHARHILFRLAEKAGADEEKKIRERAGFVLEKARGSADFAALAKEFSQDASGPRGGDLGWFSAGQMVPAFETAAFALAKGAVSDLVRTQFGLHIIKVEETREAGTRSFAEARADVAQGVAREAARAKLAARAEELNTALYDKDFEDAARSFGLPVAKTALVTREDRLPGGGGTDVVDALFALKEGEVSEIFRQGEDYYVYRVVAKRPAAVPSFEEARADVERELLAAKARERSLAEARLVVEALRKGERPEAAAARLKGELRDTALFGQRDFVTEAGVKGELFKDAFSQETGAWGGPLLAPDGRVVVYRVGAKLPAAREEFVREKDAIVARLRAAKKDLVFESWLEDLRRQRQVKVNEALVGRLEPATIAGQEGQP